MWNFKRIFNMEFFKRCICVFERVTEKKNFDLLFHSPDCGNGQGKAGLKPEA